MSILPSLRASTSRLTLPPLYAQCIHAFHASHTPLAVDIGSTVQAADKALADMQKAASQMRKSGRSMDLTAMPTPVLERTVEPPFKLSWLFRSKGDRMLQIASPGSERLGSCELTVPLQMQGRRKNRELLASRADRSSLNDMIQKDVFPKQRGSHIPVSIWKSILCLRPTYKASHLVEEVQDVYKRLNVAQAAGDEAAIRTLATGDALALAQKVAKAKRNMQWELVKHNTPPKVISARMSPIDQEMKVELAQIVVRFDTEQALITKGQKGCQMKQQRIVENCVFERHLPTKKGWRLKETLDITPPGMD